MFIVPSPLSPRHRPTVVPAPIGGHRRVRRFGASIALQSIGNLAWVALLRFTDIVTRGRSPRLLRNSTSRYLVLDSRTAGAPALFRPAMQRSNSWAQIEAAESYSPQGPSPPCRLQGRHTPRRGGNHYNCPVDATSLLDRSTPASSKGETPAHLKCARKTEQLLNGSERKA